MKIIHEITLDVARHGIQASIPLTQHDAGMHSLLIHLRNGSREIKLSEDITATLYVSNDTYEDVIVYTENGAYPNTLECNITPYITKDTGEYTAQLQIYESGTKLFSAPEFTLIIKTDRSKDSQVLSSTPYAAVITARDAAAASAAQAAKIAEDLKKEIPVYKEYGDKTYSNALVGTVSGISVLMDDVSPVEQKIPVNITGIASDTEVTVKSCGKNLVTESHFSVPLPTEQLIFNGNITGDFVLSYNDNLVGHNSAMMIKFVLDGETQYHGKDWGTTRKFSGTLTKVWVVDLSNPTSGSIDNLQIEVGTAKTEFEPYKAGETIVTTPSEGAEFRSISPNMTIWTDNANVTTEATYSKDTNAVINNLFAEIANLKATITDLGGTT